MKKCYEKDSALSCVRADNYCTNNIDGVFSLSKRSYYDVRKEEDVVEPPQDFINLLNQPDIKRNLFFCSLTNWTLNRLSTTRMISDEVTK